MHAVPRGHVVGEPCARPHPVGVRSPGGPAAPGRPRHEHPVPGVLRPGGRRREPDPVLTEVLPRRIRATHPRGPVPLLARGRRGERMSAELVTLTIDGKEVTVPKGTLIIRAAEQLGVEIPRFCDHPLLEPVAACRQCYVKVEGQRKLMTSCSTPVAPDMVVLTQYTDDEVREAQTAVLEFLLINHPLDCPVCDRGGECPLQDQALAFGPGESRYIEPKRTYRKPLPLSPLVALDRERCVLCARCTRFCDQISGDRFIELFDRGAAEQVSIAPGEDFKSPFSGNTIQT